MMQYKSHGESERRSEIPNVCIQNSLWMWRISGLTQDETTKLIHETNLSGSNTDRAYFFSLEGVKQQYPADAQPAEVVYFGIRLFYISDYL